MVSSAKSISIKTGTAPLLMTSCWCRGHFSAKTVSNSIINFLSLQLYAFNSFTICVTAPSQHILAACLDSVFDNVNNVDNEAYDYLKHNLDN